MKKILSLFAALTLLTSTCIIPLSADDGALSPGLDVLASGLTVYKTGMSSYPIEFAPEDFENALGVKRINSITVLTLPGTESGTLYLSSTPVMVGQIISRKSISKLTFVPKKAKETNCSFVFGTVSSSQPIALTCSLSLVAELNFAPTVSSIDGIITHATLENIPLYDRLDGQDPEGDSIRYMIVDYPENGTLRLTDSSKGDFVYTPVENFVGSDGFVYQIVDSHGNIGEKIIVSLTVERPTTDIEYCDMKDSKAHLSALRLAESGIMIGRMMGGKYYFEPSADMSRAEFLALAMTAAGISTDDTMLETSFEDDKAISDCFRPFVAMAEREGWILGQSTSSGDYFMPEGSVTPSEAAAMIAEILSLDHNMSDSVDVSAGTGDSISCLVDIGLIRDADEISADSALTRESAAIMLGALYDHVNKSS